MIISFLLNIVVGLAALLVMILGVIGVMYLCARALPRRVNQALTKGVVFVALLVLILATMAQVATLGAQILGAR